MSAIDELKVKLDRLTEGTTPSRYGKAGLDLKDIGNLGVVIKAATAPVNSFIGTYRKVKVYAYYQHVNAAWHVEKASHQ